MRKRSVFLLLLFPLWVEAQPVSEETALFTETRHHRSIEEALSVSEETVQLLPDTQHDLQLNRQGEAVLGRENRLLRKNRKSEKGAFDRRNLRFGANLGLSLSKNYTYLSVGPQVGYQFNNYLMTGGGIRYYHYKVTMSNYISKNNLLGVSLFGYLYPLRFFTVFMQPEINYIHSRVIYTGEEASEEVEEESCGWVPSVVVGAGLRLGRSHITLNYDLVQDKNSPHQKGWYMGFSTFF